MFEIEGYWKKRLAGAKAPAASNLLGWIAAPEQVPGFIEPNLTLMEGNADTAKVLIISAPGAVGKSTLARRLGTVVGFATIDLAQTSPLGGNFFKGGVANAFGLDALSATANGNLGLLVDALDEAQLRATPQAYSAGLLDLASIAATQKALPTVLFGRTLAAEEAWLLLAEQGYDVCLFQIDFFDEDRALAYLQARLPILAERTAASRTAFQRHREAFSNLARETRTRLTSLGVGAEPRFAGYAPVLDAICAFTLEGDALNPQARLSELQADSPIELIDSVSRSILAREHVKLISQLKESHPDQSGHDFAKLYTEDEQLRRVANRLFKVAPPEVPTIANPAVQEAYAEMVAQFAPQHPFLDGKGSGPANLVFAAYLMVWALTKAGLAELARPALRSKSDIMSGVLFDLYAEGLQKDKNQLLPLSDVGILYEALKSQIGARQRAALEITGEDDGSLLVSFEIIDRTRDNVGGRTYGPYRSSPDTFLELQTPVTNVSIQAPIFVSLGDDVAQQIGAPSEIAVEGLTIAARQVNVYPSSTDSGPESRTVFLSANDAEVQTVQTVSVKDAVLRVNWPGAKSHPWAAYAIELPPAANPDIDFMRRRLRRILTAFQSHSKGRLVRLAAKIDHLRMTKGARGAALVEQLVADKILTTFDAGKFYVLDPDQMGAVLGVDYQSLQQQRFTPQSDAYLESVLAAL